MDKHVIEQMVRAANPIRVPRVIFDYVLKRAKIKDQKYLVIYSDGVVVSVPPVKQ